MDEKLALFQKELSKLKVRFASDLQGKLDSLESDWLALLDAYDPERLERFHRGVHSIAGSGATFGLPEVSRAARSLEVPVKALMVQGGGVSPEQILPLKPFWESLRQVCRSALPPTPEDGDEMLRTPTTARNDAPDVESGPRSNKNILLVTADRLLAAELNDLLGRFGFFLHVFSSTSDVPAEPPERPLVFILDYDNQPAQILGGHPYVWERLGAPLLVISNEHRMESMLSAVRLGAESYLVKPVDTGWLLDRLEELSLRGVEEVYRVLIVDDEELVAQQHALHLRQNGMDVAVLTDPLQILDTMRTFNPELVLMDMYMPGCSGPEAAAVLRLKKEFLGLPILYLSGEIELQTQFQAVSRGGDDFLIKPIDVEHLLRAVSNRVKRYRMVHSMMVRDGLTGLLNHTNIKEQIKSEVERLHREGGQAALAMIDLDKFKSVNDTYGHPAGDLVLRNLSHFLTRKLRQSDLVGRMGGEEFAVLLRGVTGRKEAFDAMDRLREDFSRIVHKGQWGEISVSFSCGIAMYPDFKDPSTLSTAADLALYEAKRRGRNRVHMHDTADGEAR